MKIEIKYVTENDKEFWCSLDKHLPEREFDTEEVLMAICFPDQSVSQITKMKPWTCYCIFTTCIRMKNWNVYLNNKNTGML